MDYFNSFFDNLSQATNPFSIMIFLLRSGIWIVFFPVFIWMCKEGWMDWVQGQFAGKRAKNSTLLAVDIPKAVLDQPQSMKAVEQIIANLHGQFWHPNFKEVWWDGVLQDKYALEIVSIDGYIQYFIHCANYNVEIVKGAIFAQYPDAEIVEVEDYTSSVPNQYPNKTHQLFGMEYTMVKPDVYPIKTYPYFEHQLTGMYIDPIASLLEVMSRLRTGEQMWLQIMITPQDVDVLKDAADAEKNKLLGKKKPVVLTWIDKFLHFPLHLLELVHESVFSTGLEYSQPAGESEGDEKGNFLNMTTGEKLTIEEIENKCSSLMFRWKCRFIYIAPYETYDMFRASGAITGVIRQFNFMNSLRWGPYTNTVKPLFYLKEWRRNYRRNHLISSYIGRSDYNGERFQYMSHVEIASMWHFPVDTVKAPLVSKAENKKAEPPVAVPMEQMDSYYENLENAAQVEIVEKQQTADNLAQAQAKLTPSPVIPAGRPKLPPPPPPPDAVNVRIPNQKTKLPPPPPQAPLNHNTAPLHSMPGLPPGVKPVSARRQPPVAPPPPNLPAE